MNAETENPEKVHPLVSIVTPSYNQARYLEEAMNSVLEQNYPNIEYIVMDGGSTDGSLEIIKKVANRLAYWESQQDKGQTDAINKGFARARGEVLAWLNSDDLLLPGAVSTALAYLEAHPEVGMVYGDAMLINAEGRKVGMFPAAQTDLKRLKQGYVHIPQQASFFRAELWRKVGPLDPTFYFAMDYDLWVRLAREAPLVYLSQPWASFRLHGDTKTIGKDDRCWPEMLRVHYRDGGHWASPIVAKYYIRKLVAPWLKWRKRRMMEQGR